MLSLIRLGPNCWALSDGLAWRRVNCAVLPISYQVSYKCWDIADDTVVSDYYLI